MSGLLINTLRINRKNHIINFTLVLTYILTILGTVFMLSYVNHFIRINLHAVPDGARDIVYLKFYPLENTGNSIISMQNEDLELCRLEFQTAAVIAPIVQNQISVVNDDLESISLTLYGTDVGFYDLFEKIPMKAGNFFFQDELDQRTDKIVISEALSKKMYGSTDSVGNRMYVKGSEYTVSGVMVQGMLDYLTETPTEDYIITPLADFSIITGQKEDLVPIELVLAKPKTEQKKQFTERYYDFFENTLSNGTIKVVAAYQTLYEIFSNNTRIYKISNFMIYLVSFFGIVIAFVNLLMVASANRTLQTKKNAIKKAVGIASNQICIEQITEYSVTSLIGGILGWIVSYVLKLTLMPILNVSNVFIEIPSPLFCIAITWIVGTGVALLNTVLIINDGRVISKNKL